MRRPPRGAFAAMQKVLDQPGLCSVKRDMEIINLVGLVLNLVGSIFIGVSAGSLFTQIHTALMAHQTTLETYLNPQQQNVPLFTGLEKNREEELKRTRYRLALAIWLI